MSELLEHNTKVKIIKKFIKNSRNRVHAILNRLGWSEADVLKNFNTNSRAADIERKKHCKLAAQNTTTYPHSCLNQNSVVLETPQLRNLLENPTKNAPTNFNDLQANFCREEKLKIYKYVIENTKKVEQPRIQERNQNDLTVADIVAQKRREKRKKRRHRTSKPTHIEEVRAVVDLQMQALKQYLDQDKNNVEQVNKSKEHNRLRERSARYDIQRNYSSTKSPPRKRKERSKSRENVSKRKRSRSRDYSTGKKRRRSRSCEEKSSHQKRKHKLKKSTSRNRSKKHKHKKASRYKDE